MDVKLTNDEADILSWIYLRSYGFGEDQKFFCDAAKKDLKLSDECFNRSISAMEFLGVIQTEEHKNPDGEKLRSFGFTRLGLTVYRNTVPSVTFNEYPDFELFKKLEAEQKNK